MFDHVAQVPGRPVGRVQPLAQSAARDDADQASAGVDDGKQPLPLPLGLPAAERGGDDIGRGVGGEGDERCAHDLAREDDFERIDGVLPAQMKSAPRHFLRENRSPQREHGKAVRDGDGEQERQHDVDVVRQFENEDDAGQRRSHRAAQNRAHADERPEAGAFPRKQARFEPAERAADHQQRCEHAA